MSECCCKNNCVNVGTIMYSHIAQPGYMKADGRLLSRCTYAHLFRFVFEYLVSYLPIKFKLKHE